MITDLESTLQWHITQLHTQQTQDVESMLV